MNPRTHQITLYHESITCIQEGRESKCRIGVLKKNKIYRLATPSFEKHGQNQAKYTAYRRISN